jgi:hypothetical protein
VCCAAYALVALLRLATSAAPSAVEDEVEPAAVCVAWRATVCGSQYSARLPLEDLHCSALVRPSDKRISGASEGARL